MLKLFGGDVTTVNLGKKFDVIVAGELIGHLPNQGLFLENMKFSPS